MRNHLIPVLLLLVLPALYFARRWQWATKRPIRWAGGALLAAAVIASLPWQGVDFAVVKRVNLLIAATTALILLLYHYRVPWTLSRRHRLTTFGALAAIAIVNYVNYFAFHGHGQRAFVHLHDVAHYYLGAKYYPELGYTELYTAMLRAEAELYDNRFKAIEARDLATYERVHIRALLERSEPVKAAFTGSRWQDFSTDVAYFRERLDRQWGKVLLDHGFNPTPVWALAGGMLANLVPAGSERGILLLTLLDPLLLILAFAAIRWAFGLEMALLAVIHFCVVFGATFGWTGGAFGRYPWFLATVCAAACLHRGRHGTAGALLATATMLRVFPVFFAAPLAFKAAAMLWRRRTLPTRYRRFLIASVTTAALLFALTGLLPHGLDHWLEFRANMERHVANISPNVVGLTEALALRWGDDEQVTAEQFEALKVRRQSIHHGQLWLVFLPLLALTARLAPRRTDLGAAVLGLPLLYAGLSLAAYYYAFLILALLVCRGSPGRLALLFVAEAVPYILMLFEEREAVLFVYRGLLLALAYLALMTPYPSREERAPAAAA